jgi:glycolate oxidase
MRERIGAGRYHDPLVGFATDGAMCRNVGVHCVAAAGIDLHARSRFRTRRFSMQTLTHLTELVGSENVAVGDAIGEDYSHDEALSTKRCAPLAVVRPTRVDQVQCVLRWASEQGVPVTARGAGSGLSGACIPRPNGVVISFERMTRILEVDTENHVAVVEAGVSLEALNAAAAEKRLVYPVFPGENSATLGGNVATNAGGMRAVKYGVTRHHVLGLEAVLATGELLRTGGKFVKTSTGYDLTQLIIGSEGTLALVTQVTLKLVPDLSHRATLLAPFASLASAVRAVPALIVSGVGPLLVEYIDRMTMMAITAQSGISLGIAEGLQAQTEAYLLVVIEGRSAQRVDEDLQAAGGVLADHDASEVFVLPAEAAVALVAAREKSFWAAKRAGASDVVDVVVPRASLPRYMKAVQEIAERHGTFIPGCGHAGDGNVHLAVFEGDAARRFALMCELFDAARRLGGVLSGEHGIGIEKSVTSWSSRIRPRSRSSAGSSKRSIRKAF